MDSAAAAERWRQTWQRAWPEKDADAIAALYAENATYRSHAFTDPDRGLAGVRRYLDENFGAESEIECWFGEPVAGTAGAAVEWWGSWLEEGKRITLAGATLLRFDADGLVVDQRDYWNEAEGRVEPYAGWR